MLYKHNWPIKALLNAELPIEQVQKYIVAVGTYKPVYTCKPDALINQILYGTPPPLNRW